MPNVFCCKIKCASGMLSINFISASCASPRSVLIHGKEFPMNQKGVIQRTTPLHMWYAYDQKAFNFLSSNCKRQIILATPYKRINPTMLPPQLKITSLMSIVLNVKPPVKRVSAYWNDSIHIPNTAPDNALLVKLFFASTFWTKLQNIFGHYCKSKLDKVAKPRLAAILPAA